jgi:glycosyl hydrolase family 123
VRLLALACATATILVGAAAKAAVAPDVVIVNDEVRVRRADAARAREIGRVVATEKDDVALVALRGETVAFQVVVVAGDVALEHTTLTIGTLNRRSDGASGPMDLRADIFREHYLRIDRRSRNERRPAESLGWEPKARPADDQILGDVPDALLPAGDDAAPLSPRPAVPARETGTFWVDLFVPETMQPGEYRSVAVVQGDGAPLAKFTLRLTVRAPTLPYRATGAFAYYEPGRLERRMGNGHAIERQLWQLLHAHHVDALAPLARASDVERLRAAYDGTLFTAAEGYVGPAAGVPPSVVALGAYGALGRPSDDALARVDAMAAALPAAIDDVFLYAVDEQCRSPLAAAWKTALAGRPAAARVRVGQTCDESPARQAADVAIVPAQAFARATPAEARAAGRRAWIYNGELPHTGTLLLDADPRGLVADGWISAAMGIERWFYWESTFWDDDNAGGRGPIDPFTTAESFHNKSGDAALGDGLLVYPGRQRAPFDTRSLGAPRIFPSLRLEALRRGIEDAGLIALAAREHADEVARLVAQALPAALDEARPDRPAAWDAPGATFVAAREALRALATNAAPMTPAEVRAAFEALAATREHTIALPPSRRARGFIRLARLAVVTGGLVAAFVLARRSQKKRMA